MIAAPVASRPLLSALPGAAAGAEAPLRDAQGRLMTYLRLSLTDRCNFRCRYCSPAHWGGRAELLTAEEFERLAAVFLALGIRRVRLTGGEPTLRPDLVEIATRLSALHQGLRLALTTNAARLAPIASSLRRAGVAEINLSLDTLDPATFARISPRGALRDVLEGVEAAARAGFASAKLNTVVVKGVNDGEVLPLIRYAHGRGLVPRFIELMPFGAGEGVSTAVLLDRLQAEGMELTPEERDAGSPVGPAQYFSTPTGRIGFISPMTRNFCAGCNRVRVAANGDLRACLGGRVQVPLRALLRRNAPPGELVAAIRDALGQKPEGHAFEEREAHRALLPMMGIGG